MSITAQSSSSHIGGCFGHKVCDTNMNEPGKNLLDSTERFNIGERKETKPFKLGIGSRSESHVLEQHKTICYLQLDYIH